MVDPRFVWHYLCARFNLNRERDDRGVITTEFAVLAFLVVAGAILVAGIVITSAQNNANSIPTPKAP
jgi:hypothetical protein